MKREKKSKKWKEILVGILVAVIGLTIGCVIYINDDYQADEMAMSLIETPAEGVHLIIDEENRMAFVPEHPVAALIFYPGGKVEPESYAPLMSALAERNILAAIVPMPANLAVLDIDGAEGFVEEFSEIETWYMGGHSLGGSMAASYLADQLYQNTYDGLILLASYSTADLSESGISALSIYGDQDQVLNHEKYEKYYSNLPKGNTFEFVIEGGNHAQFGSYGQQDGDGTSMISAEDQLKQTVDAIEDFMK